MGTNTDLLPNSSTQTQQAQNISRGTNTNFLPSSSTQAQHTQNISKGTNTDVGNDTQQEQCHSCQVEEQPNIEYTSEFARQLRKLSGNRPGRDYIQQTVTHNILKNGNIHGLNYNQPAILTYN